MTQEQLAEALGVSRSAVNAWERDRMYPKNSIGALEEILGIRLPEPDPDAESAGDVAARLEQLARELRGEALDEDQQERRGA